MSNDTPVISVQGVSKAYRIWESPAARLLSPLQASLGMKERAAKSYRDFWALKDVSFEVRKGEAVGIIGRNGSGKSTLLQIIAGTLQPTQGEVMVSGRVAALLELGSGFNPEFTGRENIYLIGAVRGLSRREVDARFDAIAAFADIGDFIEQPVKTYSSGMSVRLAFAVCAHVDAETLIIDEALAVGDARFQLKCARTIDRFVAEGRTLLFVSHDMSSVNRLCSAAVLLEQGRSQIMHSARMVTNLYTKMMADDGGLGAITKDIEKAQAVPFDRAASNLHKDDAQTVVADKIQRLEASIQLDPRHLAPENRLAESLQNELQEKNMQIEQLQRSLALIESENGAFPESHSGREFTMGDGGAVIEKIETLTTKGQPQNMFASGETLVVHARIRAKLDIAKPVFATRIRNPKGVDVYGTNTIYRQTQTPDLSAGQVVDVYFRLKVNFLGGQYFVSVGCSHFEGPKLVVHHRRYDALEITVTQSDLSFGTSQCDAEISFQINNAGSEARGT